MAAIRETLTLEDKFSKTFLSFITLAERSSQGVRGMEQANLSAQESAAGYAQTTQAAGEALGQQAVHADRAKEGTRALDQAARSGGQALKGLGNEAARQGRQAGAAAQKSQRHARAMKEASRAADQLSGKLRSLVGAYLGLRGLKGVLELSDTLSQTDARLNMMNDGLQTTAQLNDMIYRSAQRARGSYLATADLVGKLGNLAGEAFGSTREIVAFAEQINKQIALSGASAAGAQGALLQLTQALSSGVLRGEELNSILEQTPTIAKTIADYLGLSTGEMRELASEGAITAQVVKDAMFAAAEETDRKFAQMPMTWSQIWTQFQNMAIQAFRPVTDSILPALDRLNQKLNSPVGLKFMAGIAQVASVVGASIGYVIDAMGMLIGFIGNNFATVMSVAGVLLGIYAAKMLLAAVATLMAHWPLLLLVAVIAVVITALVACGATAEDIFGAIGEAAAWLYVLVYNLVADVWNIIAAFAEFFANVFDDPVGAVARLFFSVFDSIMGIVENVAGAIDALLHTNMAGAVAGFRSSMQSWVDSTFGENKIKVARMEHISYSDTMAQWGQAGREFGKGLEDFNLDQFGSGLTGGGNEFSNIYQAANLGGLGGTVGDIGDSVGGGLGSDVADIKKEVSLAQEDLKSLVDMAAQRYVNNVNLTVQSPVIQVAGQNTGDTELDRQALANAMRDIIVEQAASASLRSTAQVR